MDTAQCNLNSRTNFSIHNTVKVASHEIEACKLPNDILKSENPKHTIEVPKYLSKTNFTANKIKNKKLSNAMSFQVASSSNDEIKSPNNGEKDKFLTKYSKKKYSHCSHFRGYVN